MASNDAVRQAGQVLASLTSPVRLGLFTQIDGSGRGDVARAVVSSLAAYSDKLSLDEYVLPSDEAAAAQHGIDTVPAITIGPAHAGIRYYGVPDGHELQSLVEAIRLVSNDARTLSGPRRALVEALRTPLDIRVFVTPT